MQGPPRGGPFFVVQRPGPRPLDSSSDAIYRIRFPATRTSGVPGFRDSGILCAYLLPNPRDSGGSGLRNMQRFRQTRIPGTFGFQEYALVSRARYIRVPAARRSPGAGARAHGVSGTTFRQTHGVTGKDFPLPTGLPELLSPGVPSFRGFRVCPYPYSPEYRAYPVPPYLRASGVVRQ